jgi:hypothetical protein
MIWAEGVMTYCLLIKNEIHTLNQQYRILLSNSDLIRLIEIPMANPMGVTGNY